MGSSEVQRARRFDEHGSTDRSDVLCDRNGLRSGASRRYEQIGVGDGIEVDVGVRVGV